MIPFHSPGDFVHLLAPQAAAAEGLLFVFRGDQLLVEVGPPVLPSGSEPRAAARPSWARVPGGGIESPDPLKELGLSPLRLFYLGTLGQRSCYAAEVAAAQPAPAGMAWQGLRTLFAVIDDAHLAVAGRALQLVDFDRNHQFCGRCGTPTTAKADERMRLCPSCRLGVYPRLSPAVMALCRRGRQLLLGRSPHFAPGVYSALAGFVEPGETLEQCVVRKVKEESGVDITNVHYFASQPWPFPNSLMIAFVCDYAGGELRPQPGEIEAVDFFDISALPKLPSPLSIARHLIDAVVRQLHSDRGSTERTS